LISAALCADDVAKTRREQLKKRIDALYEEMITYYEQGKIDLAKETFKKIAALSPIQGCIVDNTESNLPSQIRPDTEKTFEEAKDSRVLKKDLEEGSKKEDFNDIARIKQESVNLKENLERLKKINEQLEAKAREFYVKAKDLEQLKRDYDNLSLMVEKINKERIALKKENEQLKQKAASFENILEQEQAVYYQKLGTAYTEAKNFELAIAAYKKSLTLNPHNAEVHYNLGLLYKHAFDDRENSVRHLKEYLKLEPRAKNRKDVEYLIRALSASK
jgi:tetratricopeptide (TPR) repeat protein